MKTTEEILLEIESDIHPMNWACYDTEGDYFDGKFSLIEEMVKRARKESYDKGFEDGGFDAPCPQPRV